MNSLLADEPLLDILLVEDNYSTQEMVVDYLENTPYRVTVARNGHAAVERFAGSARFLAVLMDCHMPGMDGFQATRVIRELENRYGWKRTPVIAVTAHAVQYDRGQCLSAGMDDYLGKPFSKEELMAILARWVQRQAVVSPEI